MCDRETTTNNNWNREYEKNDRKKETQAHKDQYQYWRNIISLLFAHLVLLTVFQFVRWGSIQWVSNIYLSEIIICSVFHSALSIVLVLFVTFSKSMNCSFKWSETKPTKRKIKDINIRHSMRTYGKERKYIKKSSPRRRAESVRAKKMRSKKRTKWNKEYKIAKVFVQFAWESSIQILILNGKSSRSTGRI